MITGKHLRIGAVAVALAAVAVAVALAPGCSSGGSGASSATPSVKPSGPVLGAPLPVAAGALSREWATMSLTLAHAVESM